MVGLTRHAIHVTAGKRPKTYKEIKRTLKRDTLKCGVALGVVHTGLNGITGGASSVVGALASIASVDMLGKYVDEVEKKPFSKPLFPPLGAAVFETVSNGFHVFPFQFNYTETFICFLSYKLALFFMTFNELRNRDE